MKPRTQDIPVEERRSKNRRQKEGGRRASDDATLSIPAADDRREAPRPDAPGRRGGTARRRPVDRRLAMDAFDNETSMHVQDIILKAGILVACPHCNEQLTLGPIIRNQMQNQREVRCARCRKSIVIENFT